MSTPEVGEPILCSPYLQPAEHWHIVRGEAPERRPGRREAGYFYRDPKARTDAQAGGVRLPLPLVNRIRSAVAEWRKGARGWTRTTEELWQYWTREGRQHRLFYAQLEAVETILFLVEGRRDLVAPIDSDIPLDEPTPDQRDAGAAAFRRYACKLATGAGKTTVMGMLAAWSILNKVHDRSRTEFADTVLIVCPNVTIRGRLGELSPEAGDASLYRTRDLVPTHLMPDLTQGRVIVTNWHTFELQSPQAGGISARVNRQGTPVETVETITIGKKTTTARGTRYMTPEAFNAWQITAGVEVLDDSEEKGVRKVKVRYTRYVESDAAFMKRVLGDSRSGRSSILVMNDEAHHAYRIPPAPEEEECPDLYAAAAANAEADDDTTEDDAREATVWVNGLDRIHANRGIRYCVDLSATPYYLSRSGPEANKPFGWVVSDFGLEDAIESGLVKIPQVAVRDSGGAPQPHYFNIWKWVMNELSPRDRGGRNAPPKPEAVLRHASMPLTILAKDWELESVRWADEYHDDRKPVFIIVCKNIALAKVVYAWLAEGQGPDGVPELKVKGFRNREGQTNTIRVDAKVVSETDSGEAKSDETRWMRFTLDTVGRSRWPADPQGRPVYPEGFEELAAKLGRPLHPPGRDVRCVVSVGMLTEGWDCNTVTHIIGLRPFMSQLLCEQVVGRALRRRSYTLNEETDRLEAEVAQVLGVPFELIPVKAAVGPGTPRIPRNHVKPLDMKERFKIEFPRVAGYTRAIRNRIAIDWKSIAPLPLDPSRIPPEYQTKDLVADSQGRPSLMGPGRLETKSIDPYRRERRVQELVFEMARDLTRRLTMQGDCEIPAQALFPQLLEVAGRYVEEKVLATLPDTHKLDIFVPPYYGYAVERLAEAIRPAGGESPEVPIYEKNRKPGSTADVDFWTAREVREVERCHLNYIVADTTRWEQSAAYHIDRHPRVAAFVKNAGLGFAIPYTHNREDHDYIPDFIVRLDAEAPTHLILEVKGRPDDLEQIKTAAAERWCAAVNAEGSYGRWLYRVVRDPSKVPQVIDGSFLAAVTGLNKLQPETSA